MCCKRINKITKKARELEIEKHESFVTRLHSYWTLKRQSRDGYPLLNSRKFGENTKILNVNVVSIPLLKKLILIFFANCFALLSLSLTKAIVAASFTWILPISSIK